MDRSGKLYAWLRQRRSALHRLGKGLSQVDKTAYVHRSAKVSKDVVIAEYGFVGPGCQIDPLVTIGRYTLLASHVAIIGDDHRTDLPGVPIQFSGRPEQTATRIDDDAWLGYRAIIRRGVHIGRGAVVGANSVVTKDVAAYEIVAGVPARHLGWRFADPDDVKAHDAMLSGPLVPVTFANPLRNGKA